MKKNKIVINGVEKTLVVINQNQKEVEKKSVAISEIHHIHIIDRSLSMSREINGLIENVKETINCMGDNDYVSIIWFSGIGQYRTLIKGAKKDTNGLFKLLDGIKSTIGLTCFSESIKEASEIVSELKALCPNFSITMFTDGYTVTDKWSSTEERTRVLNEITTLSNNILSFNTIGYGYYYDKEMLTQMSQLSQFGIYTHSDNIKDYSEIFKHNYEKINELVVEKIVMTADKDVDILYLTRNSSKLVKEKLELNAIDKNKNQFVFIGDGDFNFKYNDEEYNTADLEVSNLNEKTFKNICYVLSYENYYIGNRKEALNLLVNHTGDKGLIDEIRNAFTYDESSKFIKKLKRCAFKPKYRYKDGEVDSSYLPDPNHPCVMDILQILSEGHNFYIPVKDYKRIGVKTTDSGNLFEKTKESRSLFSDFVYNKKHMNVSIRFVVEGKVKLNENAINMGLPNEVNSQIFRNHTIIKDGNLNINKLPAIIDVNTLDRLTDLEEKWNLTLLEPQGNSFIINLDILPVINETYIKDSNNLDTILSMVKNEKMKEAEQKVVKFIIKELIENDSSLLQEGKLAEYSKEQIEILKEHGLDKNFNYGGVNNKSEKNDIDFYESKQIEYDLKGVASIPSINAVRKKIDGNKKLNAADQMIKMHLDTVVRDKEILDEKLKSIKKELILIRNKLFICKVSKVLTGDWYTGLEVDKKGNYLYTSEKTGDTLILKTQKVKKYF